MNAVDFTFSTSFNEDLSLLFTTSTHERRKKRHETKRNITMNSRKTIKNNLLMCY